MSNKKNVPKPTHGKVFDEIQAVVAAVDDVGQPYFADSSRAYLAGLMTFVWLHPDRPKTLARVRTILNSNPPRRNRRREGNSITGSI